MAGLMNKPMLRDTIQPNDSSPEPISATDRWALSLTKPGAMDPSNPYHAPEVERMRAAIAQGQLSEAGVKNLADLNPKAAPALYDAYSQYSAASAKQKDVQGIVGQYINQGKPAIPDRPYSEQDIGSGLGPYQMGNPIQGTGAPAVPPSTDYQGAVNALATKYPDLAEKYQKLGGLDKIQADKKTSIDLAYVAAGQKSGNPNADSLTPDQARKVLDQYQQPIMYQTYDANGNPIQMAAPRGAIAGLPGAVPLSPAKVQQIPEKEKDFLTKAQRDLQSIDLLLQATDPKATEEQKKSLADQGIPWNPNAFGAKGYLPNSILQRTDPSGITLRAMASDLAADKIHERYAGNLTAQELSRSAQWGYNQGDEARTAREKFINQKRQLINLVKEKQKAYSPQTGFAPSPAVRNPEPKQTPKKTIKFSELP